MNLIFDLDGTLINSKERLYRLFIFLLPGSNLSYDEYWTLKRQGVSHKDILADKYNFLDVDIEFFISQWMELIESEEYLIFDQPLEGVERYLDEARNHASLHLCTARQFERRALEQLERLGLDQYFDSVLVTGRGVTKEELIRKRVKTSISDWIIGDTAHDIKVGHALGINSCGVDTGFLSTAMLRKYKPTQIVDSVTDFQVQNL